MHPLARPNTKDPINGITPGQRIILVDGRRGVLDQAVNMGSEAYVTLDNGTHVTVQNGQINPEPGPPPSVTLTEDLRWPDDFRLDGGEYVQTREPYE